MRRWLKRILLGSLVLLVAVGGLVAWKLRPRKTTVYTDADTIRFGTEVVSTRDVLWQPPTPLPAALNAGADAYEPRISFDGNTMFFVRGKAGGTADIFIARRTYQGWTEPAPLAEINSERDDLGPEPSADGRELYFYSDRDSGVGGYDLWLARLGEDGHWQPPINLGTKVNSEFNDYGPALAPDGRTLYFASNRPKPSESPRPADESNWPATIREDFTKRDYDLFVSRPDDSGFGPALPLDDLNTPSNEGAPSVSPSGDFLYFASDREGGHGGFDLYRCRRIKDAHARLENLGSIINTPANELDPGLTQGGHCLYFSSDRPATPQAAPDGSPESSQSPRAYHLYQSLSREVFTDTEIVRADIDWAAIWSRIWKNVLWALLALLLLALLLALLRDAYNRKLGLLTKCLLASLAAHLLLMLLMNSWQVTVAIAEALGRRDKIQVTLAAPGQRGDLSAQIHAALTDVAAQAAEMPAPRRVETPVDIQTDASIATLTVESPAAAPPDRPLVEPQIADASLPRQAQPTPTPKMDPAAKPEDVLLLSITTPDDEPPINDSESPPEFDAPRDPPAPPRRAEIALTTTRPAEEMIDKLPPEPRAAAVDRSIAKAAAPPAEATPRPRNLHEAAASPQAEIAAANFELSLPTLPVDSIAATEAPPVPLTAASTPIERASPASTPIPDRSPPSLVTVSPTPDSPPRTTEVMAAPATVTADAAPPAGPAIRIATNVDNPSPSSFDALAARLPEAAPAAPATTPEPTATPAPATPALARGNLLPDLTAAATPDATRVNLTPATSNDAAPGRATLLPSRASEIADSSPQSPGMPPSSVERAVVIAPATLNVSGPREHLETAAESEHASRIASVAGPLLRAEPTTATSNLLNAFDRANIPPLPTGTPAAAPSLAAGSTPTDARSQAGAPTPDVDLALALPKLADLGLTLPPAAAAVPTDAHPASPTATPVYTASVPRAPLADASSRTANDAPDRLIALTPRPARDDDALSSPTSLAARTRAADAPPPRAPQLTDDAAPPSAPTAERLLALRVPREEVPPEDAFAQRAPEHREALVQRLGGSHETEEAVARALQWLAAHQSRDGHWDADNFDQNCGHCGGETNIEADVALTGLSLLCFLGADHTHRKEGSYRENVRRGIRWLLRRQRADGDLRGDETMYSHGIATIALSEAYGMTKDPALAEPVRLATDFIVKARNRSAGGWRYDPGQAGDTSVLGWQIMALKSARMAGIDLPDSAFDAAGAWLDKVARGPDRGHYAYQPSRPATPAMTAEGMFTQQLIGRPRASARMDASAKLLLQNLPNWKTNVNTYYWYYGTLAMYQHQGEPWKQWNEALTRELLANQKKRGAAEGSWDPVGEWAPRGGRIYQTALCTLMLEVYYRYLPLYSADAVAAAP